MKQIKELINAKRQKQFPMLALQYNSHGRYELMDVCNFLTPKSHVKSPLCHTRMRQIFRHNLCTKSVATALLVMNSAGVNAIDIDIHYSANQRIVHYFANPKIECFKAGTSLSLSCPGISSSHQLEEGQNAFFHGYSYEDSLKTAKKGNQVTLNDQSTLDVLKAYGDSQINAGDQVGIIDAHLSDNSVMHLSQQAHTDAISVNDHATLFMQDSSSVKQLYVVGEPAKAVLRDTADVQQDAYMIWGGKLKLENGKITLGGDTIFYMGGTLEDTSAVTLTNNGRIKFVQDDAQIVNSNLQGKGTLIKQGVGKLTLTGKNNYHGGTQVYSGTLELAGANHHGNIQGLNLSESFPDLILAAPSVFEIYRPKNKWLEINAATIFTGSINNMTQVDIDNSHWVTKGNSVIEGLSLYNKAKIIIPPVNKTNDIYVSGNYSSDDKNNEIHVKTQIGNNKFPATHLTINGNVTGTTYIVVDNNLFSGFKDEQDDELKLIEVNGKVDGDFVQRGRITVGAYDYRLLKQQDAGNYRWSLTNKVSLDPAAANSAMRVYRPEVAGYIANQAAANTLFMSEIQDRFNESEYLDPTSGEKMTTHMWMKSMQGIHRFKDTSGQLNNKATRYSIQIGDALSQWSATEKDRGYIGLTGGYGKSEADNQSNITGYSAHSRVHGYNLGAYTSWYADYRNQLGAYVDILAQYSWYKNSVTSQNSISEQYQSKGFTTAISTGYNFKLAEREQLSLFIQPKAKVVWQGIRGGQHTEANGMQVSSSHKGNLMTDIGLRSHMIINMDTLSGKQTLQVEPYLETSWIHNDNKADIIMDNASVGQAGNKNIAQVKIGVEGTFDKNLNIWGNLGHQAGRKGYSDTSAGVGIKYHF
ncbi:autotransporter outer membrane beta-barrel domain-containing protein [Yersinia ruckeri]|uniref:autotransporter outer membrane beta-barrel domain-containing protein n=1 Tax=Yersinia ruckeri TaxID=29486 RepID=UPI0008FE02E5|nr:autotransporter outer membrane beta-barrel domain-containing protein [Yersinia ruckeri]EKN4182516.1 autotransporter outer membrane beta-barrel domain-containing protein [Yersinia ruckeri]EKN4688791.1 autotransporter outer membrane beta-barrel domain-containing protein [Yersinia ruckeri]EKN4692213.1 autotransporter outer membrane beta-barrel domain-containing protein [Yersinia ruckeri]EKN4695140.1 autotransporter outer membrane beta-barrel domain-containing protein [Yersinia ruckeri]ELM37397